MPYYIQVRGKAFGVFSNEKLLEMKKNGKLNESTLISENKVDWLPASKIAFLYPDLQQKSTSTDIAITDATSIDVAIPTVATEISDWFYSSNGTEGYGPVTVSAIAQMVQSGTLKAESLAWQEGQFALKLGELPQFSGLFGVPALSIVQQTKPQLPPLSPPNSSLFCAACGNQVVPTAQICTRCSSPIQRINIDNTTISRITYILLGLFLGGLGIHNFYAGRTGKGLVQLLLVVCTLGLGALITGPWALFDIILVTTDGQGRPFRN
jgi:hypothetical protein